MKAIAICVLLLFANAFKSVKERKRATIIAIAIVGRAITIWEAIQKRSHEPIYKTYTKIDKERQLCYRKVGRAINKWGAIEKNSILLSQYWNLSNKPL